jgi:hypothetical protein
MVTFVLVIANEKSVGGQHDLANRDAKWLDV